VTDAVLLDYPNLTLLTVNIKLTTLRALATICPFPSHEDDDAMKSREIEDGRSRVLPTTRQMLFVGNSVLPTTFKLAVSALL
jgi:hypothetical protein